MLRCIVLCAAPDIGFHPGPSRKRWRDWLRLLRSDSHNASYNSAIETSTSTVTAFSLDSVCAQKSEAMRSPDVTQRTLFLLDEVSRKRGLFEKEQQEEAPTSPGVSRQVHLLLSIHLMLNIRCCAGNGNKAH